MSIGQFFLGIVAIFVATIVYRWQKNIDRVSKLQEELRSSFSSFLATCVEFHECAGTLIDHNESEFYTSRCFRDLYSMEISGASEETLKSAQAMTAALVKMNGKRKELLREKNFPVDGINELSELGRKYQATERAFVDSAKKDVTGHIALSLLKSAQIKTRELGT